MADKVKLTAPPHEYEIDVADIAFQIACAHNETQAAFFNSFRHNIRTACSNYGKEDMQLLYIAEKLHPKTIELFERLIAFTKERE